MKTSILARGIFTAFLLSTSLAGCAATSGQETPGQYLDDSAITTKVKAALFDDLSLKAMQVNVTTFKKVVQLSGFVDSQTLKTKASKIARHISGVEDVKNDIHVK